MTPLEYAFLFSFVFCASFVIVYVCGGGLQAWFDCRRIEREIKEWKKRDAEISKRWNAEHDK